MKKPPAKGGFSCVGADWRPGPGVHHAFGMPRRRPSMPPVCNSWTCGAHGDAVRLRRGRRWCPGPAIGGRLDGGGDEVVDGPRGPVRSRSRSTAGGGARAWRLAGRPRGVHGRRAAHCGPPQLRGALRLASGEFGFPDRAGVVQQGMRAGYGAATRGTGEIAAMFMRGSWASGTEGLERAGGAGVPPGQASPMYSCRAAGAMRPTRPAEVSARRLPCPPGRPLTAPDRRRTDASASRRAA